MKSIRIYSIIFLSVSISAFQVTLKCWPKELIENISHGYIYSATADMCCSIKDVFESNEELEVANMTGFYREYDDLLMSLSFNISYPSLPEKMIKGIGRVIAKSRGHRLKGFGIFDQTILSLITRDSFANMPELEVVKIVNNRKIEILPGDAFADLSVLIELRLDKNNIKKLHIDLLKNLRLLKDFSASGNPIEIIEEQLFRNNKNLTSIDFSDTKIKRINVDFKKLPNIVNIKVKTNGTCQILKDSSMDVDQTQSNVIEFCRN
ncbi:hypothetical protein ACKWTF_016472 [Chironomus riparius]